MKELLNTIRDDTAIVALFGANKLYLNYTTDTENCLLAEYHTVGGDSCKEHVRLKITVIADSMETCEAAEKRIKELVLSFGDNPVNINILKCTINGGGVLHDEGRMKTHKICYYDVVLRGVAND